MGSVVVSTANDDEILSNLGYRPTVKGIYKYISGDGKSKETELVMERRYSDDKKQCSLCKCELPVDSFTKVMVARYMKNKKLYVKVYYRNCYCKECYNRKRRVVKEE